jgi:PAS domain-containing protein
VPPSEKVALAGSLPPAGRRPAESARWLAALVENSSDSIVGVDVRGIIQSWNSGAQRLLATRLPK